MLSPLDEHVGERATVVCHCSMLLNSAVEQQKMCMVMYLLKDCSLLWPVIDIISKVALWHIYGWHEVWRFRVTKTYYLINIIHIMTMPIAKLRFTNQAITKWLLSRFCFTIHWLSELKSLLVSFCVHWHVCYCRLSASKDTSSTAVPFPLRSHPVFSRRLICRPTYSISHLLSFRLY